MQPVLIIPNLAIHFNREMNKGVELRKQVEMLPVYGTTSEELTKGDFLAYIAEHLGVQPSDTVKNLLSKEGIIKKFADSKSGK